MKNSMKKAAWVILAAASMLLAACELLPAILGTFLMVLLGVTPQQGFSDPQSPDYGYFGLTVAGENEGGVPSLLPASQIAEELEVETEDGEPCTTDPEVDTHEGKSKGSFVMLVDDSGSTELATAADCEGCPTDPNRMRVQAVQALAKEIAETAPEWRLALMDFGTDGTTSPFTATRIVQGYTAVQDEVADAAQNLESVGGTPLWDSTYEVLESLHADVRSNFSVDSDPDVGWGIVVLSDGDDTASYTHTADTVIAKAQELGIAVHMIGLGPAADTGEPANPGFSQVGVGELRRVAEATGGFYGSVGNPDQLPELYKNIADSLVGGYQKVKAKAPNPPPSGQAFKGRVGLRGTGVKLPFQFIAP